MRPQRSRSRLRCPAFTQVYLDEPAFEGNNVARRSCQGIEHLAPELGRNTVREPALKSEGNKGARIEQPAAFLAGNGRNSLLVDCVVYSFQCQSGEDCGFGRGEQGFVW